MLTLDKKCFSVSKPPIPKAPILFCTPFARLCVGQSGANHENTAPLYGFQSNVAFCCLVLRQI